MLQGTAENLVPIAPVSNAVTSGATTDSVTISWAVPLGVSAPITSYTIFVDDAELETVDASVTSYELTELSAGTSYDVTIRATNSNGSEDATFTVVTESPTAPGAPTTVLASDITSTEATLTWDAPEAGKVEEYLVTLDGVNQGEPLNGDVFSYELTGLTVNTEYEVGIFAKSPEGLTSDAGEERFSTFFKPMVASGGDKVYEIVQNDRVYRVHEFTTVGTDSFEVESTGNAGEIEYLVIGGGGGGGSGIGGNQVSGGGGAGGYRTNVSGETSGGGAASEPEYVIQSAGEYEVTVGAGGNRHPGRKGGDSKFADIFSEGGGSGGGNQPYSSPGVGGSGGGTNANAGPGSGIAGQGYNGGQGDGYNGSYGGGGGGAGAPGRRAYGGSGLSSEITGTSTTRAAGGNSWTGASGGANTGTGGAGRNSGSGGFGGSGIVIVRYPITAPFN